MIDLSEQHFMYVDICPWCGATSRKMLYQNQYMATVQKCMKCGFVYSGKTLMKKVPDVGCGNGDFLDLFKQEDAQCYGVEYGAEAIKEASARYPIWAGEFPYIKDINISFDLIIFRGSLQYCVSPKKYLKRAMELLNCGGLLYITSSPNAQSLCFQLFKENFTLPVGVTDYYAFSEPILTDYIKRLRGRLISKYQFYEETPYASPYDDITTVAKAITYKQQNKPIDFKSPAFYDNMLT